MNNVIASNLEYYGANWAYALRLECDQASRSLHISALSLLQPTPNGTGAWPDLWRAWKQAAARGVKVNIWLPAPMPHAPATRGNHGAGRACAEAGIQPHFVTGNRLLHAKTCVIDARSVWIGSGNFTAAAAHHNHEAYLRADCVKIAAAIIARWEELA